MGVFDSESKRDLLTHYQEWIDGMMSKSTLDEKVWGLAEETGEICGKMKRMERGDYDVSAEFETVVEMELGDVLFYVTAIALHQGLTLAQVMESNMKKINSRQRRGQIYGRGDSR